jgi:hypothetical protein
MKLCSIFQLNQVIRYQNRNNFNLCVYQAHKKVLKVNYQSHLKMLRYSKINKIWIFAIKKINFICLLELRF